MKRKTMKIPQIRCSDVNAVKRIIFLLVLLIPFCLAGCSSDDDEGDNGGEGPNEDAPVLMYLVRVTRICPPVVQL